MRRGLRAIVDALASVLLGLSVGFVLIVAALVLAGCSDLSGAKHAANTLRTGLHAAAPVIRERCVEPLVEVADADPVTAGARALEVDRSGCPQLVRAYDVGRGAHLAAVAAIAAVEAGQCSGVSPVARDCDLGASTRKALDASLDLAERIRAIGGAK